MMCKDKQQRFGIRKTRTAVGSVCIAVLMMQSAVMAETVDDDMSEDIVVEDAAPEVIEETALEDIPEFESVEVPAYESVETEAAEDAEEVYEEPVEVYEAPAEVVDDVAEDTPAEDIAADDVLDVVEDETVDALDVEAEADDETVEGEDDNEADAEVADASEDDMPIEETDIEEADAPEPESDVPERADTEDEDDEDIEDTTPEEVSEETPIMAAEIVVDEDEEEVEVDADEEIIDDAPEDDTSIEETDKEEDLIETPIDGDEAADAEVAGEIEIVEAVLEAVADDRDAPDAPEPVEVPAEKDLWTYVEYAFEQLNQYRLAAGKDALILAEDLNDTAAWKLDALADDAAFDHALVDFETLMAQYGHVMAIEDVNSPYERLGENLGVREVVEGTKTDAEWVQADIDAWQASDAHNAVMLEDWTHVGFATLAAEGKYYFAQWFGAAAADVDYEIDAVDVPEEEIIEEEAVVPETPSIEDSRPDTTWDGVDTTPPAPVTSWQPEHSNVVDNTTFVPDMPRTSVTPPVDEVRSDDRPSHVEPWSPTVGSHPGYTPSDDIETSDDVTDEVSDDTGEIDGVLDEIGFPDVDDEADADDVDLDALKAAVIGALTELTHLTDEDVQDITDAIEAADSVDELRAIVEAAEILNQRRAEEAEADAEDADTDDDDAAPEDTDEEEEDTPVAEDDDDDEADDDDGAVAPNDSQMIYTPVMGSETGNYIAALGLAAGLFGMLATVSMTAVRRLLA